MPDWRAHVRQSLGKCSGDSAEEERIIRELAEHLEEYYLALCDNGSSEEEAFAKTCAQAGGWDELRRGILSAKQEETMQERIRQVWLPGLVTSLGSYFVLALLQRVAIRSFAGHPGIPHGVVFYSLWLVVLPVVGAGGGYLSRRWDGAGWQVYLGVLVPAMGLAVILVALFLISTVAGPRVPLLMKLPALAVGILGWTVLPGAGLCLGAALQGLLHRNPLSPVRQESV